MILFAYRAQLRQSIQGQFSEDAKQHVRMLLDFLTTERRKLLVIRFAPFLIRVYVLDMTRDFHLVP